MSVDLRVDWCDYQAAKYAVMHWHYSKAMPAGRNVYLGVWESNRFVGAVLFGMGSGSSTNGEKYNLASSHEMAELTRVALTSHVTPVSKMVSIAIGMVERQSPALRLLISMADPKAGHVGGIYQAMNWIYTGETKPDVMYLSRGAWVHHRTATSRGSAKGLPSRPLPPKHRYLYPLDRAMRKQIAPLAKPYPKRDSCGQSVEGDASGVQSEGAGSIPADRS